MIALQTRPVKTHFDQFSFQIWCTNTHVTGWSGNVNEESYRQTAAVVIISHNNSKNHLCMESIHSCAEMCWCTSIRHKRLHLRFLFTLVGNDGLLKCRDCREHHSHYKWACVYFWQSVWWNPLRSSEVLHSWGSQGEVVTPAAKAWQKHVVILSSLFFFYKLITHGIGTYAHIHMNIDNMLKDHITT